MNVIAAHARFDALIADVAAAVRGPETDPRLVAEAGLGLAPGAAFGPEGEGWLRWCFAAGGTDLDEGLARLARWVSDNRQQEQM